MQLLAFLLGLATGLTLLSVTRYVLSLRRQLKAAQKALEARETAPQPVRTTTIDSRGVHTYPPYPKPVPATDIPPTFGMGAVGPSAIASREAYEADKQRRDTAPRFANVGVLNPSLTDIRDAASEATNGGKPN